MAKKKQIKIAYFPSNTPKATVLSMNGKSLDKYCTKSTTEEDLSSGNYILDATFLIEDNLQDLLQEEAILKVLMDYGEEIFRVSKVTVGTRYIDVVARQITIADSLTLWLEDVRPTNLNGQAAVSWMLDKAEGKKEIKIISDIDIVATAYYQRMSLYKALHDNDNCFLNRWGGEVLRRGYTEYINSHIGIDRGFTIREGKNLTGFECNSNIDNLITKARGQGFDGILGNYINSPLINRYNRVYTDVIKYDDVKVKGENNDEGYDTLAQAQAELDRRIREEYSKNGIDKIKASYNINFVQLEKTEEYKNYVIAERVYLGDTIRVYIPRLGTDIKVRAISKKYDVLAQKTIEVKLSNYIEPKPLTIKQIVEKLESMDSTETVLQMAKDNATALIKGGMKNSYVIVRENEVLIMDTKDVNTATKVWRWNNGGLGYSSTGYNGTFGTAITNDGAIVADFITTGILNANLIKTGILKSFNGLSWINMENGTFNFANKLTYDGNTTKFTGDIVTYTDNGNKAIEIIKQMLKIYDWENGSNNPVGSLYSSRVGGDERKKTIVLANAENALMSLSYHSANNIYYPYIHFDEQNLLGNNCAITFQRHFALKGYKAFFGQNNQSQISGSNTTLDFVISDGGGINFKNHSGKHFLYITDNDGYRVSVDSLQVNGDFNVIGNKNAIQKTEHYGTRAVHCYEMADTYWGDLGEGIINEDGECIVYIEDVFRELINTDINYHVFTQTYSGNITGIKRYKDYFIVTGEPKTSFSWELKARRKGFENNRLQDANFSLNNNLINLEKEIKDSNIKLKDTNIKLEDSLNKNNSLDDLI